MIQFIHVRVTTTPQLSVVFNSNALCNDGTVTSSLQSRMPGRAPAAPTGAGPLAGPPGQLPLLATREYT